MKTYKKCIECDNPIAKNWNALVHVCDICHREMCDKCWHSADIITVTTGFNKVCKKCLSSLNVTPITKTVLH